MVLSNREEGRETEEYKKSHVKGAKAPMTWGDAESSGLTWGDSNHFGLTWDGQIINHEPTSDDLQSKL